LRKYSTPRRQTSRILGWPARSLVKRRPVSARRFALWTTPIAAPAQRWSICASATLLGAIERIRRDVPSNDQLGEFLNLLAPHRIESRGNGEPVSQSVLRSAFRRFELARAARMSPPILRERLPRRRRRRAAAQSARLECNRTQPSRFNPGVNFFSLAHSRRRAQNRRGSASLREGGPGRRRL
jgi:hypothetical protein